MQTQGKSLFSSLVLAFFINQYAVADDIKQQPTAFSHGDWAAINLDFGRIGPFSKQKIMTKKNVNQWGWISPFGAFFWCTQKAFEGRFSECLDWPPGSGRGR